MTMLRIMAVLSVAILTMGSGGVARVTGEQPSGATTVLEPETVDTAPVGGASEAAGELDAAGAGSGSGAAVTEAASSAPAAGRAPVPVTPVEMAQQGPAVELALSDDYIQGRYYTGTGLLGVDRATGHLGVYFSDNRDIIGNVGLMTDRIPLLFEGLTLSAGGRGYVALLSEPDDDVVGFAPGIEGRYGLPYDFPVAIVGNIFYAPDILTLGDAEDIIDIDARVEAEIIPDIVGFIGYREFRFDSDEGDADKKAASEIQVGARFLF